MAQHEQCIIPRELLEEAALQYKDGYTSCRGNGYVKEYNPFHPRGDCRGLVPQHRLVIERSLGRLLDSQEVVHHIDSNRQNNDLSNLELFATQAEHMSHHHKEDYYGNNKCYDPYSIERIRKAAEDPSASLKSLGMSPQTVCDICKRYGIEWKHGLNLTESQVRDALKGRTTREAAELLDCHPQTLYNNFDHLLEKRRSPGFLNTQIEAVLVKAKEEGISETARYYETSRQVVSKALKRAGLWDDYQGVSVLKVGGHQESKQKP